MKKEGRHDVGNHRNHAIGVPDRDQCPRVSHRPPVVSLPLGRLSGCLRCGSELIDGAGHCLFGGHTMKHQRSLLDALIQRLKRSEEPVAPATTIMLSSHVWGKHSIDS